MREKSYFWLQNKPKNEATLGLAQDKILSRTIPINTYVTCFSRYEIRRAESSFGLRPNYSSLEQVSHYKVLIDRSPGRSGRVTASAVASLFVHLNIFCSTGLLLTSTSWVRTTIELLRCPLSKQCAAVKSQQHQEIPKKYWKRRELNPGRLGEKCERNLCAIPTPLEL